MAQMNNKVVRSIAKLMEAGFDDEKKIAGMTVDDMLKLPNVNVSELVLISGIQKAVRSNRLVTFLGGGGSDEI